ncbi:hypothetical protein ERO13_A07G188500v2 [Gossypium hirsutum]|uniref:Protein-tyrosine-phosphatase IBR5 n=2 Tax=Gossypium TaxID=3633 RepID=A0ABM3BZJ8_GOSHI|nr:protein-tyrosine-phosphatase IBR5-like [Gossypium hirsutum]KAG4192934.1 hypothetical protein ERO13_A07G188500v2 [Gossypium hirsutum]TYI20203.1 hypothetical protein ES332_A07G219800v1 [Gossypium tomentosum]
MRKRERENPCGICGHYHKYEEEEVCGICGHRIPLSSDKSSLQVSAFPSLILPGFLYLGSYDNASRSELLKTQGITHVLNTVPACQNLYKNSFTYHCLQDGKILLFDDAIQFLEQCERDKARVLVHCMSGKNRSPAIVVAFLMKSKGWRLPQSYQWVKERRPSVDISQAVYQQLQEYEQKLYGSSNSSNLALLSFQPGGAPLNFSLSEVKDPVPVPVPVPIPAFSNLGGASIFARLLPHEFTFGASQTQKNVYENLANPSGCDISMDNT